MSGFFALAGERAVVRRALGYALAVGMILIAINHGDKILARRVTGGDVAKMLLTVCVPYAVSTLSSVAAMRDRERNPSA